MSILLLTKDQNDCICYVVVKDGEDQIQQQTGGWQDLEQKASIILQQLKNPETMSFFDSLCVVVSS